MNSKIPLGSVRAVSIWMPNSAKAFNDRYADFSKALFYRYGETIAGRVSPPTPGWQSWILKLYGNP